MGEIMRKHRYPLIARYVTIARRPLTSLLDRLSTDRLKLGEHFVQDDLLKSVAPIRRELDRVGASSYATNVRMTITC